MIEETCNVIELFGCGFRIAWVLIVEEIWSSRYVSVVCDNEIQTGSWE